MRLIPQIRSRIPVEHCGIDYFRVELTDDSYHWESRPSTRHVRLSAVELEELYQQLIKKPVEEKNTTLFEERRPILHEDEINHIRRALNFYNSPEHIMNKLERALRY